MTLYPKGCKMYSYYNSGDDILEQNFYTEKCDLQQLQIQKKMNKEILNIEQAAFKAAVKAGVSNGTDNEENG